MQGYKYTCEPGDVDWTPMNSNLHMQSIKVPPNLFYFIIADKISIHTYLQGLGSNIKNLRKTSPKRHSLFWALRTLHFSCLKLSENDSFDS